MHVMIFDDAALLFVQLCCAAWIESCLETVCLSIVISSPRYDTVELPINEWRKSISSVQSYDNVVEDELKSVLRAVWPLICPGDDDEENDSECRSVICAVGQIIFIPRYLNGLVFCIWSLFWSFVIWSLFCTYSN
jgi:hypothetical protein